MGQSLGTPDSPNPFANQALTGQGPSISQLSAIPDASMQQQAMGMSPGQMPTLGGPTAGYLGGKNQKAPGTPGSALQGPPGPQTPQQAQAPALALQQNSGLKQRLAALLARLRPQGPTVGP